MMRDIRRILQRFIEGERRRARQSNSPAPRSEPQHSQLIKLPQSYQEAAQSLADFRRVKSNTHRAQLVKTSREGTHPDMVTFYRKLSKELDARGMPFFAFEFYRSPERQARLKSKGVSNAGPGSSPHQWGCAVDVVHGVKFWDLSPRQWAVVGAIGKEVARKMGIKVVWGGDFSTLYDPAHWELEHWRDLRRELRYLNKNEPGFSELSTKLRFGAAEARAKAHKRAA
ncbi:M15 family metallopeptidase [Marinovum sp. E06]|uniref:M15 family metallopeptidase n=1 Tax=Marinovum sp. E06 TaxID=3449225 RepID=UPI003EDC4125